MPTHSLIGTGKEEVFLVPDTNRLLWQLQSKSGTPLTRDMDHFGRKVSAGLLLPPMPKGVAYTLVLAPERPESLRKTDNM